MDGWTYATSVFARWIWLTVFLVCSAGLLFFAGMFVFQAWYILLIGLPVLSAFGYVLIIVGPSMARARELGLPPWAGLVVPAIVASPAFGLPSLYIWFEEPSLLAPVAIPPLGLGAIAWWGVARDPLGNAEPWRVRGPLGRLLLWGLSLAAVVSMVVFVLPVLPGMDGSVVTLALAWFRLALGLVLLVALVVLVCLELAKPPDWVKDIAADMNRPPMIRPVPFRAGRTLSSRSQPDPPPAPANRAGGFGRRSRPLGT
jgi:hypothetical protein